MSISLESLFSSEELELELEWLEARDTLLGENFVKQDVKRAIELAAASEHPQCQWLTSLFAEKTVTTPYEARAVFFVDEKNSPASLCFAALLSRRTGYTRLRRSAALGCPLAQAKMARETSVEERFQFARSAASQRERDGLHLLGTCYDDGDGCEYDLEKAKECHLIAAQLGEVWSMNAVGRLSDESDPQRWFWWGRAAVRGWSISFLFIFSRVVEFRFWKRCCCCVSDW
jgi:TPR repeat protein